ncbi:uncharacterized protein LOC141911899 isoform X2 [Tubulanus polymorphus]|uniref:uncharacterized protein LOC141911899 isoform X2 n=1 Tax=Tubulanus polymorphus TaxID=672921 RepID=UPI003DA257F8
MAAEVSKRSFRKEEKVIQKYINAIDDGFSSDDNPWKPSLAEQVKIGFFSQDRLTQTDDTEILLIKDLTENVQNLLQDVDKLKKDIDFTRNALTSDYDSKVQQKGIELYCRINGKISNLEKIHEDRMNVVRRAFQTQLTDALAKAGQEYMDQLKKRQRISRSKFINRGVGSTVLSPTPGGNVRWSSGGDTASGAGSTTVLSRLSTNMNVGVLLTVSPPGGSAVSPLSGDTEIGSPIGGNAEVGSPIEGDTESSEEEDSYYRQLRSAKKKDDQQKGGMATRCRQLELQISQQEALIQNLQTQLQEYSQLSEKLAADNTAVATAEAKLEEANDLNQKLKKRIGRLEDAFETKEEQVQALNTEIGVLREQVNKRNLTIDDLKHENKLMKESIEKDKMSSKNALEQERQKHEGELQARLDSMKAEMLEQAKLEAQALMNAESAKYDRILEQKNKLEEQLAKEKLKNMKNAIEQADADKIRKNEMRLQAEVNRLNKELEKINKIWEKKFAILQQSLHALKDEAFLRQTLQRQAAQLHQASISYATDTPMGIMPMVKLKSPPPSQPLPDIPPKNRSSPDKDYMSYTVSAPSGRGTGLFSLDENQVMSDTDPDMPEDVTVIPEPPNRATTEGSEMSHNSSSSKSHVVVLPSAT